MAKAPANLRSLARSHTELAVQTLAGIALSGTNEGARVRAAEVLLDRGWGKAPTTFAGEDGEGAITVLIRHIVENAVEPRMLDGNAGRVIDHRQRGGQS